MNIIEAIKSGKPFTRKDWDDPISGWCHVDDVEGIPTVVFMTGKDRSFIGHVDDLLADDWEIQEPAVTITRTQLLNAAGFVRDGDRWKYVGEAPSREEALVGLSRLACKLGLGEP